jgi:hypothetical protein
VVVAEQIVDDELAGHYYAAFLGGCVFDHWKMNDCMIAYESGLTTWEECRVALSKFKRVDYSRGVS